MTHSTRKIVTSIARDTLWDCFDAVNSTAIADLFEIYSSSGGQVDGNMASTSIKISIATAYLAVLMRLLKALKPILKDHFLVKSYDDINRIAQLYALLLRLYCSVVLLIKVGHFERSGEDEFSKRTVDELLLGLGGGLTGALAIFSCDRFRHPRPNLRTMSDIRSDGFFGLVEGFTLAQSLGSVLQNFHNLIWDMRTSKFSLTSIATRFSLGGVYSVALGCMYAQYPLAQRKIENFSFDIKSLAFILNNINELFYTIIFSAILGENLQNGDSNKTGHLIAFAVLLGISILKNILMNCCCSPQDEEEEEYRLSDQSGIIPQEEYASEDTPSDVESPLNDLDCPLAPPEAGPEQKPVHEEEAMPQGKSHRSCSNIYNFFKSFCRNSREDKEVETKQNLLSMASFSQANFS